VNRRPRILLITPSYPTRDSPVGGIFVRDQAEALARSCDVRVVHLERVAGLRGARPTRVDGDVPTWRIGYPRSPRPVSLAGLFAAGIAGASAATAGGFRPDVIHAHFFLAGLPAVLLGRIRRVPVVVTEHWSVFLPDDPMQLAGPLRVAAKLALERADLVVPVSDALDRGIAAHGIRARTRVVPNLVDERLFHPPAARPPSDPPRLLAVALLYEAKGIDLLLEATAQLLAEGRRLRLDVVGDGQLRGEVERQLRRLGLTDSVSLLGFRTKAEVAELMHAADLFVLPSRFDNNPVALIEALTTGLPAVATDVGGVADILGSDGILTSPNVGDIATAIAAALDRLGDFDRAAIAARAAARYGSRHVTAELIGIYRELTDRESHRHASG
jgi:glycosyltransferase involved in cell wall biosynthesis